MTRARVIAAITVLGAAAISACNLLTGASDLRIGDGGVGPTEGGSSSGGDGASDTGTSVDGADLADADIDSGPPRPPCTGANGKRGVCMPASDGWMPVMVPRASIFGCQTEYPISTSTTGVDGISGPCNCSCEPAAGSCAGNVRVEYGGATCGPGSTVLDFGGFGGGTACITNGLTGVTGSAKIVPLPSTPPTGCAPKSQTPTSPSSILICSGTVLSDSTDCASGHSCVAGASTPLGRNCVAKDGDVACPAGFGNKIPTGTNPTDTRTCSGCTCGTDCSDSTLKVYKTSNCTSSSNTIRTTSCSSTGFGPDASSAAYQPGDGCNVTKEGTVSGTITFSTPRTVCCP